MIRINHIGVVVKSIAKILPIYLEDYGYKQISGVLKIENQNVRVVLLNCDNDVNVELIEPITDESPIASALKRGGGINHICYETDEFDALYKKFCSKVVVHPKPAPEEYFDSGRTFFVFRKGELVEFLEKKERAAK